VFITTCTNNDPRDLIKSILGCDDLPAATHSTELTDSFPWHIDTKYYTADVHLCAASAMIRIDGLPEGITTDAVQALLLLVNPAETNTLDKLEGWQEFVNEHSPEVRILVCENFTHPEGTGISRQSSQEWCLRHGFELVELSPEQLSDTEDDFPETTGVARIIQALHAHMWPNMSLKDKAFKSRAPTGDSKILDQAMAAMSMTSEPEQASGSKVTGASSKEEIIDSLMESDLRLYEILGDDDGENLPFECMFEKLRRMKELAKDMPVDQRKIYAEKVAVAFWKALGGDEEEIDGLGSDVETEEDDGKY